MTTIYDSIGHNLVKLCKQYFNRLSAALSAFELYEGQQYLLFQLWDEDSLGQAELTKRLGVEAATVSKTIERLENAGFIRREPSPDDARANIIYLTERGRSLEQPVKQAWFDVEEQLLAQMTTEERLLLRRLFLQMRDNLK